MQKLFIHCLLALLVAWAPVTALPASSAELPKTPVNRPIRDKWALIVGVGTFQDPKIPKLKYASKDARDFRDYLIREANFQPDHVRILLDEKATQRRVLSELGNRFLARVAKPDDLVVLFFSSHGSPAHADLRGKNFVVAYDSDPEDLFTTGIEMDKILDSIQSRVLSERVLLLLDACHSGGAVVANAKGLSRPANFDAEALAQGSGQLVICSSEPDEASFESKRYQNGIFTRKLLDALRTKGSETTLGDAFPKIKKEVAAEVQEDYGNRQSPSLSSKWNGNELILAAVPAAPQMVPHVVQQLLEPDSSVPSVAKPAAPLKGTVSADNTDWRRAVFMYKRGDYASAIDVLRGATKSGAAKDADAHYHLANALQKIGRSDEALKEYKESFRLNPNGTTANYCLQMINYYTNILGTARGAVRASTPSGAAYASSRSTQQTYQPSRPDNATATDHGTSSIPAALIAQARAKLPPVQHVKYERPYLADVLNWGLQDRANFYSDAVAREQTAKTQVEEAQNVLKSARAAAGILIPNARAYGESEEQFRIRVEDGERLVDQLLIPYVTELDVRTKHAQDEANILQSCAAAYNQVYGGNIYKMPTICH